MKLLVVGHTYVVAFNQSKYVEMKRQCADLELRILTPPRVNHVLGTYPRETAADLSATEVIGVSGIVFGRSQLSYLFSPEVLASTLRTFTPDRIHIEEDPYSAVGVETVLAARLFAKRARISFFIWDNLARDPAGFKKWLKWSLDKFSLRHADLVVCGNTEGEQLLRSKRGYHGRTAVLPQLGLDPTHYEAPATEILTTRNELGVGPEDVLIGFVGRLVPEKGILGLLGALDGIQDRPWRLLVLGGGPMEGAVEDAAQRLNGRVRLVRSVPHTEVPRFIRALDILTLPSITTTSWKEQFGMVLAQAMMAGVVCLGSSSGAIPEVIGPRGLVFEEGSVADLSEKLVRLIESPDLRRGLATAGREHALANFSNTAVARAYLRAFGWRTDCPSDA